MTEKAGEAALEDFVRAERVRFVFIQSALPIFFSPAAASILALALWRAVPHERLVFWVLGLTVIAAMRLGLVRTYPKQAPTVEQVRRWERTFVASIVLVDLWWGVGALLLVPATFPERALVFSFLIMMAGGHSASYAAHPATVTLGVLALIVPITIAFAFERDVLHRAMATASLLYMAASFRSIKTLSYFFGRSHRLAHEVQRERDRAEQLARTDFLTSLNNRRAFCELGEAAVRYARRYTHPLALMILDIDHFKSINDKHGHAAGDRVLCAVATLIGDVHRKTDVAGRLGGEEFAVLLPETDAAAAAAVAERLRAAIREQNVEVDGQAVRFTTSIGVASLRDDETLDALIARADASLYAAKRAGRDRVELAVG